MPETHVARRHPPVVIDHGTFTFERWQQLCTRASEAQPEQRREFIVLSCVICDFAINEELNGEFKHEATRYLRGKYRDAMKVHLFRKHSVFGARRGDFLEAYRYEPI